MPVSLNRRLCLTVAAFALAAPASALADVQDGRSPDTKDAALVLFDGRSPDTIDAAARVSDPSPSIDGRSPDTRDAALAHAYAPVVTVVEGGFDWMDAGIGAGGGFAVAAILTGAVVAALRTNGRKLAA